MEDGPQWTPKKWGENDDEWICFDVFFVFLEGPLQMFKARYSRVSTPNRAWPPDPTWDDPLEKQVPCRAEGKLTHGQHNSQAIREVDDSMMSYDVICCPMNPGPCFNHCHSHEHCTLDKLDKEKCNTCDTCDTSTCEIWTLGPGPAREQKKLLRGCEPGAMLHEWHVHVCVCLHYLYIYIWSFVMMYRRLSCIILLSLILHSHQGSGFNSKAIFGVP